jgi:hypothetical protein
MHDPLSPHPHDPAPSPPSDDPTFRLLLPDGRVQMVMMADLRRLPQALATGCFIVSTGHGTSGPFAFGGALLRDLLAAHLSPEEAWTQVEVVGEDGFGARLHRQELEPIGGPGPILLAYVIDGVAMRRRQGLVRLIVPGENDDALKQVKWVSTVQVVG